ncbi:UNVERIFIED_CONTAM: hypothetical protein NCL1_57761 [Trichonephila clavipes]
MCVVAIKLFRSLQALFYLDIVFVNTWQPSIDKQKVKPLVTYNSQKFLPRCYREVSYMTRNRESSLRKTRGFVQASKLQKK